MLQGPARKTKRQREIHLLATYSHADAAYTYVGAQALPYPSAFPEDAHGAVLFPVEDAGEHVVHIGACADQEEDDEEEGLEVEEGGLYRVAGVISIGFVDLNGAGESGRTMVARCQSCGISYGPGKAMCVGNVPSRR